jgi:hypothetical protein
LPASHLGAAAAAAAAAACLLLLLLLLLVDDAIQACWAFWVSRLLVVFMPLCAAAGTERCSDWLTKGNVLAYLLQFGAAAAVGSTFVCGGAQTSCMACAKVPHIVDIPPCVCFLSGAAAADNILFYFYLLPRQFFFLVIWARQKKNFY